MATYPTLSTAYGSDPSPMPSIDIDRSEDGVARGRALGNDKARFRITHKWLSAADKATLDAFYSTNRLLPFDYVSPADNATYSCIFVGKPGYERHVGDYWTATVQFEQV